MLRMVHFGNGSNQIWYSVLDSEYVRTSYELYVIPPHASLGDNGTKVVRARGGVYAKGTDLVAANVTLRLRRDEEFAFDENLTQATRWGTSVDINLECRCPGDSDSSGGTWRLFAEVLRAGASRQSSRTEVSDCRHYRPSPVPAFASLGYRIEATGPSQNPAKSPVRFTGHLVEPRTHRHRRVSALRPDGNWESGPNHRANRY